MAYNVDDFNRILADINAKIDSLASDSEEKAVLIESIKNAFDNKNTIELQQLNDFAQELSSLRNLLENSKNEEGYGQLLFELRSLEQAFKTEIMNINFDKNSILDSLKEDIVKVFEKSSYLQELYPDKNNIQLEDIQKSISDNLTLVQQDLNEHIKSDFDSLAQAIGALYGVIDKYKKEIIDKNSQNVKNISDDVHLMSSNSAALAIKVDELLNIVSTNVSDSKTLLSVLKQAKDKTDEIASTVNNNLTTQIEDLKMDAAILADKIDSVKNELALSTENNFVKIITGINDSSELIRDFKENVSVNLTEYLSAIKSALEAFVDEVKSSQDSFGSELFDRTVSELQKISGDLNKYDSDISHKEASYKTFVDDKVSELHTSLNTLNNLVLSSAAGIDNSLSEKIVQLDELISQKSEMKDEKLDSLEKTLNEYSVILNNHFDEFCSNFKNFDEKITSKVDTVSDVVNNVSAKADEITLNIRNNLSNQIGDLKTDISVINDRVDNIKDEMKQTANNNVAQILTGISSNSGLISEFKDNISDHLSEFLTAIKEALETFSDDLMTSQENLGSDIMENKMDELKKLSDDITRLESELGNRESNYRIYIDEKVEDIHNYLVTLEDMVSSSNIGIDNSISAKIAALDELIEKKSLEKDEKINKLQQSFDDYLISANNNFTKIDSGIQDLGENLSSKVDIVSNSLNEVSDKNDIQISNIQEIKGLINSVFEEIQKNRKNIEADLSVNDEKSVQLENNLLEHLKEFEENLSEKTSRHKFDTIEKISEITGLIENVKTLLEETESQNSEKLNEKLSNLEAGLNEDFALYNQNISTLQEKIGEYFVAAEHISSDANEKLENSIVEVAGIRNEVKNISEKISTMESEKFDEFDSKFDQVLFKFTDIISGIDEFKTQVNENIKNSLKDNVDFIDQGLGYISQNIQELASKNEGSDLNKEVLDEFGNKINTIKDELSLVSTDVIQAVNEKGESLLESFGPLKDSMDKLLSFNFDGIVEEMKNQIQISYLNLLSELNDNLTDNQDAYFKIENTYKDIVSKCASLESSINEFAANNIEMMSSTVANIDANVRANLDKTNQFFDDWHKTIEELDLKLQNNNKEFEHSLVDILEQIDKTLDEKLLINQKDTQDYLSQLFENQNFVQLIEGSSKENADRFDELKIQIQEGFETSDFSEEMIDSVKKVLHDSIDILNEKFVLIDEKMDILAQADNTEIIDEIADSSDKLMDSLQGLHSKLDEYSKNDNSADISDISFNCANIQSSLAELNSKVDVLAMADNSDIQDEIVESSDKLMSSLNELHTKVDILAISSDSGNEAELSEFSDKMLNSVTELHSKIDILAMAEDTDLNGEIADYSNKIMNSVTELHSKIDILAMTENADLSGEIADYSNKIMNSVTELHSKIDILALSDNSNFSDEIANYSDKIMDSVSKLSSKIDNFPVADNSDLQTEISNSSEKLMETIDELHKKVDILVQEDNSEIQDEIEEIKSLIQTQQKLLENNVDEEITSKLEDILHILDNSDDKISKTLELLHNKVDILAMADDSELKEEIQDIKDLIYQQKEYYENDSDDEKSQEISNHLQKLISEINKIEKNVSEIDLEKNSQDIKDSVMTAMLSAMDQVSFVEETEEIKDFVEEKTNAINQTLLDVKKQLSNITNAGDDMDFYSYTLHDVESDLAKLRLTLNELSSTSSSNEFGVISANISRMAKSIEQLQISRASDNVPDLKAAFDKLSEDILSLSARTNKILLNSDESQKVMSLSLKDFSQRTQELQNRLDEIDNKKIDSRLSLIEQKIDESVNTSKILQNVMIYLGEWMDGTSETISSIYDKSVKAASTHDLIENLKMAVPAEQSDLLKIVESRFEEQQSRIDRLEQKLEKALEMLSDFDENIVAAKIDRIDKRLGKLTENIEKLTAYVDEE